MTMLDRMRRHKNWLKWSLALVCLAFVFFYVPDFLTPTAPGAAPNDVVANVEGRQITTAEFRRVYYQQLQSYQLVYGGDISEQLLRQLGIDQQILQQLIDEAAALVEARRLSLTVSDVEIRARILSLPGFQEEGVFIGEARYRQLLRLQLPPLTTTQFEDNVRTSLLLEKLRGVLTEWIDISEDELREEYRLRTEKVKLDIVTFPPADYRDAVTLTDAEVEEHLEANAADYRIQEKRKIRFLAIDAETLRAEIVVASQDVENYYSDNIDQYSTPEQVRASHILFNIEDEDETVVRERAGAVLAEVRGGADFATLAETHSDDVGSATLGGDLDFFSRDRMVPEFEEAAFSMESGTISDLVRTEYGFHIIKVVEKREAANRPLDEVREQIADQLEGERAQARADALATELSAGLNVPADLDRVAAERGWAVQESNFFARNEPIDGLGLAAGVASAAFEFSEGEVGGPLRTATGHVFLAVIDRQESYAPELEEVRTRVEADLTDVKAMEAARQRAAELTPQLQAADAFTAAAERVGLATTTTELVTRGTALPGLGLNPAMEEIVFSLEVGGTSDVLTTDDAVAVIHVVEREEVTAEGFADAVETLRTELRLDRQSAFFSAYMTKAKERMQIDINFATLALAIT